MAETRSSNTDELEAPPPRHHSECPIPKFDAPAHLQHLPCFREYLRQILIAVTVGSIFSSAAFACPQGGGYGDKPSMVIDGAPRVIDGTTLKFIEATIHLESVFAPGLKSDCYDQSGVAIKCGEMSKAALEKKVRQANGAVRCILKESVITISLKFEAYGYCGTSLPDTNCLDRDFGAELAATGDVMLWDFLLAVLDSATDIPDGPNGYSEAFEAANDRRGLFKYKLLISLQDLMLQAGDWQMHHNPPFATGVPRMFDAPPTGSDGQ